jgi:hypothetical protein
MPRNDLRSIPRSTERHQPAESGFQPQTKSTKNCAFFALAASIVVGSSQPYQGFQRVSPSRVSNDP